MLFYEQKQKNMFVHKLEDYIKKQWRNIVWILIVTLLCTQMTANVHAQGEQLYNISSSEESSMEDVKESVEVEASLAGEEDSARTHHRKKLLWE